MDKSKKNWNKELEKISLNEKPIPLPEISRIIERFIEVNSALKKGEVDYPLKLKDIVTSEIFTAIQVYKQRYLTSLQEFEEFVKKNRINLMSNNKGQNSIPNDDLIKSLKINLTNKFDAEESKVNFAIQIFKIIKTKFISYFQIYKLDYKKISQVPVWPIVIISLLLITESGMNGLFFGPHMPGGILQGWMVAVLFAFFNIFIGWGLGRLAVFKRKSPKFFFLRLLSLLIFIPATLTYNLMVAGVREFYETKGVDPSLRELISVIGDLSYDMSIQSMYLIIVGLFFSLISYLDGWKWEPSLGYRKLFKNYEMEKDLLEQKYIEAEIELKKALQEFKKDYNIQVFKIDEIKLRYINEKAKIDKYYSSTKLILSNYVEFLKMVSKDSDKNINEETKSYNRVLEIVEPETDINTNPPSQSEEIKFKGIVGTFENRIMRMKKTIKNLIEIDSSAIFYQTHLKKDRQVSETI